MTLRNLHTLCLHSIVFFEILIGDRSTDKGNRINRVSRCITAALSAQLLEVTSDSHGLDMADVTVLKYTGKRLTLKEAMII